MRRSASRRSPPWRPPRRGRHAVAAQGRRGRRGRRAARSARALGVVRRAMPWRRWPRCSCGPRTTGPRRSGQRPGERRHARCGHRGPGRAGVGGDGASRGPAKFALLGVLGRIGGKKSLDGVRAALGEPDEKVKDAAVHALIEWPDTLAADDLLALAKTSPNETHQVLATRGYIRVCASAAPGPTARRPSCWWRASRLPSETKRSGRPWARWAKSATSWPSRP